MKNKNILVTGGAGYIGSHACFLLLENGYKVYTLDSFINSNQATVKIIRELSKKYSGLKNFHFFKGDIRDEKFLIDIFQQSIDESTPIDAVMHFAGLKSVPESICYPLKYWDINFCGTINLIKVMDKFCCNKFIFSSSATVYNPIAPLPLNEESEIKPINNYGLTKVFVEKFLKSLKTTKNKSWKVSCLRYFNPIGAHHSGLIGENWINEPSNIFPNICRVAKGELLNLKIYGNDWPTKDGTCVRDFIHVMDLVEGHFAALKYLENVKGSIHSVFNLGTGKGVSILELISLFEKVNNVKIPFIIKKRREGDSAISYANNEYANMKLNWKPKRSLDEMCEDGWRFHKSLRSL